MLTVAPGRTSTVSSFASGGERLGTDEELPPLVLVVELVGP